MIDPLQNDAEEIIQSTKNLYKYNDLEKTAIEGLYINNKDERIVTSNMTELKKIHQVIIFLLVS